MKYEYKFVEIPLQKGLKTKVGETFELCKKVISDEAENGWKLVQIVTPANEKTGVAAPYCYQIILERPTVYNVK